jgi:serine/threonine-protein kinase
MFEPGQLIDDRYVVERALGSGSFGQVVSARSVADGERVAIKILLPELTRDQEAEIRFLREAQAAARLESPHTARVLDVRRLKTGAPYLVMELLDGMDLESYLQQKGPLSIDEAVALVAQACDALTEAHALGIVHRDLKLANMFLVKRPDGAGTLKILDFGIAKVDGHDPAQVALTASSVAFGSPQYMSPEQLRSTRDVDARTDLWSLGVCFYEMLTRAMPFEGASQPLLFAAILGSPAAPLRARRPDVPADLAAIISRCLEKDLTRRWQSARELKDALAAWAMKETGKPITESRAPPPIRRMAAAWAGAATGDGLDGRTVTQEEWDAITGGHRAKSLPTAKKKGGVPAYLVVLAVAGALFVLSFAALIGYLIGRAK